VKIPFLQIISLTQCLGGNGREQNPSSSDFCSPSILGDLEERRGFMTLEMYGLKYHYLCFEI